MTIANDAELKDALESLIMLRPCITARNIMLDVIDYKGVTPNCTDIKAELADEVASHAKTKEMVEKWIQEYIVESRKG